MPIDPTNETVTARMTFTGVMLICVNKDHRCEVGMITCPEHDPQIKIKTCKAGNEEILDWPPDKRFIFRVNKPQTKGVAPHPQADPDHHFDKVIDLEGPDFHNSQVSVNLALLSLRRLGVTDGQLYSHKLTDDQLDLVTWSSNSSAVHVVKNLGRISQEVGLNILCRDEAGSGIDILDSDTGVLIKSLPQLKDDSYQIDVNNDCGREGGGPPPPDPKPPVGSDFRFYYDVIDTRDYRKFDLQTHIVPGGPPPTPGPGICETAFLGKTKTLGVKWPF